MCGESRIKCINEPKRTLSSESLRTTLHALLGVVLYVIPDADARRRRKTPPSRGIAEEK
jgi:hypothetical protein